VAPTPGVHAIGAAAVPAAPGAASKDPWNAWRPSGDVAEDYSQGRHASGLPRAGVPKDQAKYKAIFIHGFDSSRLDVLRVSPVSHDQIIGSRNTCCYWYVLLNLSTEFKDVTCAGAGDLPVVVRSNWVWRERLASGEDRG
jgi:hypothetical protein